MNERTDLQSIIKRRQRADFVGRQELLARFTENLALPVDDERRTFVFAVHGVAGVGKTYLVQQFQRIAAEHGAACGSTDESAYDVIETMDVLSAALAGEGSEFKDFRWRLSAYRERQRELMADPQSREFGTLGALLTRAGMAAAKADPSLGVLADVAGAAITDEHLDRFRTYVSRKFRNAEDVRLVLEPVAVLTKLFVADLSRLAKRRTVSLVFDTFERTSHFLQPWILDLLEGKYGALPAELVMTIAGQRQLDVNDWAPYLGIVEDVPLAPFTEAEARELLARHNVHDPHTVATILSLSGRLPVWLNALAVRGPADEHSVEDPANSAVERFLKWEPDARLRDAALTAATPRHFNADVLAVISNDADEADVFDWVCNLPFVTRTRDNWKYHDVARSAMLRLLKARSPQRWRDLHQRLAGHYRTEREAVPEPDGDEWEDPTRLNCGLEECYHQLCAEPQANLADAMADSVAIAEADRAVLRRWVSMMNEAAADSGDETLLRWTRRLDDAVRKNDLEAYLTILLGFPNLASDARLDALVQRGYERMSSARFEDAIEDFDQVLDEDQDMVGALGGRAVALRAVGRYGEALADAARLAERFPSEDWPLEVSAGIHHDMGRHLDALIDYTRALDRRPDNDGCLFKRAEVYLDMGRAADALNDYTRALELNPNEGWYFSRRAVAYRTLGDYDKALADHARAAELEPGLSTVYAQWAVTYEKMGNCAQAVEKLTKAIELDEDPVYLLLRSAMWRGTGDGDRALTDMERAIELDPEDAENFFIRAVMYREMGRFTEALADHARAIELVPGEAEVFTQRAVTYRDMERYAEALADHDRAIELGPDGFAIGQRAITYRCMGRFEDALADHDRAIELGPDEYTNFRDRAVTYRCMGRFEDALADHDRAIELGPDEYTNFRDRAVTYRCMGRFEDALADHDRAIELGPNRYQNFVERAVTYALMGREEEKAADVARAIELNPGCASMCAQPDDQPPGRPDPA